MHAAALPSSLWAYLLQWSSPFALCGHALVCRGMQRGARSVLAGLHALRVGDDEIVGDGAGRGEPYVLARSAELRRAHRRLGRGESYPAFLLLTLASVLRHTTALRELLLGFLASSPAPKALRTDAEFARAQEALASAVRGLAQLRRFHCADGFGYLTAWHVAGVVAACRPREVHMEWFRLLPPCPTDPADQSQVLPHLFGVLLASQEQSHRTRALRIRYMTVPSGFLPLLARCLRQGHGLGEFQFSLYQTDGQEVTPDDPEFAAVEEAVGDTGGTIAVARGGQHTGLGRCIVTASWPPQSPEAPPLW